MVVATPVLLTPAQALRYVNKLVLSDTGCWLWQGHRTHDGYGQLTVGGVRKMAHRVIWEAKHGFVPATLTLDHRCRTPACVNPRHLELVTMRENILRGHGWAAQNARKLLCKRGHEFTYRADGTRTCLTCAREHTRQYRQRVYVPHPKPVKTHCKQGHPFTPENTGQQIGGRRCIQCGRDAARRCARRRRERLKEQG